MASTSSLYTTVTLSAKRKKALKPVMFKDKSAFFELNQRALTTLVPWPEYRNYQETKKNGCKFRFSFVGIKASNEITIESAPIGRKRETTRTLVKNLYLKNFHSNEEDAASIEYAVNQYSTFAVLVSQDSVKGRGDKNAKKGQHASIFELQTKATARNKNAARKGGSSLECVAAITVSACTTFQFVHWLAVSGDASEGSDFTTWRRRRLGAYLFNAVIRRAMLPGVDAPTKFVLQCLNDPNEQEEESPLSFYVRLGFQRHLEPDNGWSLIKDDAILATQVQTHPTDWVTPEETAGMCLMILQPEGLVDVATAVIEIDEAMPDSPSNLYAEFPLARPLYAIEQLAIGLDTMKLLGHPLFEKNANFKDRCGMHSLRDDQTATLVSGTIGREWRRNYDCSDPESPSRWFESSGISMLMAWVVRNPSVNRAAILIVPPDITRMIGLAWQSFKDVSTIVRKDDEEFYDDKFANWQKQEVCMMAYLKRHPDLFTKKLVLFINNQVNHWTSTTALNPGEIDSLEGDRLCGFLHMDSAEGKGRCQDAPPVKLGFKFFLNYAHSSLEKKAATSSTPLQTKAGKEAAFKEPFGQSFAEGNVSAFPQIMFEEPAIVSQLDPINCALGVVVNAALLFRHWLNLHITRIGRDVIDESTTVILGNYFAPIQGCPTHRSKDICAMLRKEVEIFIDRLARLTHADNNEKLASYMDFIDANSGTMNLYYKRPNLYDGIAGAPLNDNRKVVGDKCGVKSSQCEHPGLPIHDNMWCAYCIRCEKRMHIDCAMDSTYEVDLGLCYLCSSENPESHKREFKDAEFEVSSKKQKTNNPIIVAPLQEGKDKTDTEMVVTSEANKDVEMTSSPEPQPATSGKTMENPMAVVTQSPQKKKAVPKRLPKAAGSDDVKSKSEGGVVAPAGMAKNDDSDATAEEGAATPKSTPVPVSDVTTRPRKGKPKRGSSESDLAASDDDEEHEFDENAEEEAVTPEATAVPLLLPASPTKRAFRTQQSKIKSKGGLERLLETRAVLADDQTRYASEKDLDLHVAESFKRAGFKTDDEFATYETQMKGIIARCKKHQNKPKGYSDAVCTQNFLQKARKQRQEMIVEFRQEWMASCEGAIRGIRYMALPADKFRARVLYYSFRKKEMVTATVDVQSEWMNENFGEATTAYIMQCSEKEKDGFMFVLTPDSLTKGTKSAIVKVRFVATGIPPKAATADITNSPRKQKQTVRSPSLEGYWQGVTADGKTHQLLETAVAKEVKKFYVNRNKQVEEKNGGFVVLQDNMEKPVITIDDSAPVISVRYQPETTKQVKSEVQVSCNERALLYGTALGKNLKSTRHQSYEHSQKSAGGAPKTTKIAEFGYDALRYESAMVPEQWKVKLSDNTVMVATGERIKELFGEGFATEVRHRGENRNKSRVYYIDVPVGAVRMPRLSYFPTLARNDAPQVRYSQGPHDTCIYSSFASALHYLGAKHAAHHISTTAVGDAGSDPVTVLQRLSKRIDKTNVRFLKPSKLPKTFVLTSEMEDNMMLVGSLVASDGSVNHAVTITQGWIFDSNEQFALPLTKEALDVCTQSEDEATASGSKSTFSHFGHGNIFRDSTKRKALQGFKKPSKK